jgi:hypothetical protein
MSVAAWSYWLLMMYDRTTTFKTVAYELAYVLVQSRQVLPLGSRLFGGKRSVGQQGNDLMISSSTSRLGRSLRLKLIQSTELFIAERKVEIHLCSNLIHRSPIRLYHHFCRLVTKLGRLPSAHTFESR